jgi:hypothetical protein
MTMRLRRLFALLTSAAMLHLTVVAGDAACATHGANAMKAGDAAARGRGMPMSAHVMSATTDESGATVGEGSAARSGTPPCEVPTQPHCCDALVGCSVASAVTDAHEAVVATASSSARILAARHDAPASFAPAPEPPPPKA